MSRMKIDLMMACGQIILMGVAIYLILRYVA